MDGQIQEYNAKGKEKVEVKQYIPIEKNTDFLLDMSSSSMAMSAPMSRNLGMAKPQMKMM